MDNRQNQRFDFKDTVVLNDQSKKIQAETNDISSGGLNLTASDPGLLDSEFALIHFPGSSVEPIEVEVCHATIKNSDVHLGIKFSKKNIEQSLFLKKLIQRAMRKEGLA